MAQISGAVDLSGLAKVPDRVAAGRYVTELTEATFDTTVRKSLQYPVVIEFYSPRAPESGAMGQALSELADAAGGAWLLARMNVDAAPQIVKALQIRAVPMVVGVVGGQLVPLWQGSMAKPDAEKIIGDVLKMAAGNGILGRAEPQGAAGEAGPEEDPRYTPAYEAMGRGDYGAAEAAFATLLAENPADGLAKIGAAQAGLLHRVAGLDPRSVMAAAAVPDAGVDAILDAADLEVASGDVAAGFARLTTAIAGAGGADRDRLRVRLLALFDTQDPADKVVLVARRTLATALY